MSFLDENGLSRLWFHIVNRIGTKADVAHSHNPQDIGAEPIGAEARALASAKTYTNQKIDQLVNGAPAAMDTLHEVAQAFAENEEVVTALNAAIGSKANQADLEATNILAENALPKSGGSMTGALNLGSVNSGEGVNLTFGRLGSDDSTEHNAQSYLTRSGLYKIDLYNGGTEVNNLTLAADEVRFGKALSVSSGGTGATDAAAARASLGITPENIGALPSNGGKITGQLTIGSITSTDAVPLVLARKGTDESAYQVTYSISDGNAAIINLAKSGANINRMTLGETKTTFTKPVDIAGGGTGASTAAEARTNLGITPENIGALAASGGKVTGNLTIGSKASTNGYSLVAARLGTDNTTQYEMLYSISNGNTGAIDLYKNGTSINRMALGENSTTFMQPVTLTSGGTGATTPEQARANLEITPENIGAQPIGDYALKSDIPIVPVTSVNNKTGNVELTAYDVGAVRLNGSSAIAGNITLGSDTDTNARAFALVKKANETSAIYNAQFAFSGAEQPMIAFYKDGTLVNRLVLGETSTAFMQPVDIASGGTGANTASAARAKLGITPENIGAAPTSHGNHVPAIETADNARFLRNDNTWATITPANIGAVATNASSAIAGNLTLGNPDVATSRLLTFKRQVSGVAEKAEAQMYLTASGALKVSLVHDGTEVNSWTMAADTVTKVVNIVSITVEEV